MIITIINGEEYEFFFLSAGVTSENLMLLPKLSVSNCLTIKHEETNGQ